MALLRWVIICERAIIEQQHNTLSMIAQIENIHSQRPPEALLNANPPPLIPHRFNIVQMWERSKGDTPELVTGRMRFHAPNGKLFAGADFLVDLRTHEKVRAVLQVPGFPLMGEGKYTVQTQLKNGARWKTMNTESFRLIFIDPPAAAATH